jgi:hypothetical protein
MDWKFKRKNRALRNALLRCERVQNKESLGLLRKRLKEVDSMLCLKKNNRKANSYLEKLGNKTKKEWF